jgi:hypothetical protein
MAIIGKQFRFVLVSVILSMAVALVLAEVFLGFQEKYTRKSVLDYPDIKRCEKDPLGWGGLLRENLSLYVTDGLGGRARWTNNAAGFRSDREFSQEPQPGILRILALGDSFNVGYRVDQDETFSHLRDKWINRKYGRAEILVAETEEPTTALYYMTSYGLQLKPEIVLLGITLGNDIVQAYQGLDAHGSYILTTENGKVHIEKNQNSNVGFEQLAAYKIPPDYLRYETPTEKFIRRASRWLTRRHLLRPFYQEHEAITSWGDRDHLSLFDPNNGFGVFADPLPPKIEDAYQRLFRILEAFALLCRQNHILFAVQIFPQRYQVQPEDWARAVAEYGLNPSRFNLNGPNQRIEAFCRTHAIVCVDPTAAMAKWYSETRKSLYLPRGDMHWNKVGHRVFFDCSLPALNGLAQAGFKRVQATISQNLINEKVPDVSLNFDAKKGKFPKP